MSYSTIEFSTFGKKFEVALPFLEWPGEVFEIPAVLCRKRTDWDDMAIEKQTKASAETKSKMFALN